MTTSPGAQSLPRECARRRARFRPARGALAVCDAVAVGDAVAVCPAVAVCRALAVCRAEAAGLADVGAALNEVGSAALDVAAADDCRGVFWAEFCGEQLHTNTPITPITPASTRTRRRQ